MRIAVYPLVFHKGCVLALPNEDGSYRLPSGLLRDSEIIAETAKRVLRKEAAIEAIDCQFVGIYDSIDRNPAVREIAAVVLVRKWRQSIPITGPSQPAISVCWVPDFNGKTFQHDENSILAEQGIFAPLSQKIVIFEA